MIKAGALTYTIFVGIITAILCILMITLAYMNRRFFIRTDWHEQVKDNAFSGIQLGLNIPTEEDYNAWHDLYQQGNDSVKIKKRKWGLFEVVTSYARKKGNNYKEAAILAYTSNQLSKTALWLTDHNRPLNLCGNALLKGNCYIPVKGIEKAYIEGTNYKRDRDIYGSHYPSKAIMPVMEQDFYQYWEAYLEKRFGIYDSIIAFEEAPFIINNSFHSKTLLISTNSIIDTRRMHLEGNVILYSQKPITINASSSLRNIVVMAPEIIVQKGFEGTLHLIATDSVIIQTGVLLKYPSSVFMFNQSKDKPPFLRMEEGSELRGTIVSLAPKLNRTNKRSVEISFGARIKGLLYCQGNLQLSGKVNGSVIAKDLLLATKSGIYENHLLDGEINRELLPENFASVSIKDWDNKAEPILWIY